MSPEDFSAIQFDYLIIGGGTAGLVVAARLSEDPKVTVGVLEAGDDQSKNPMVMIPGLALNTVENPDLDWTFKTVAQENNYGRVHMWPRGKCLGGSSAINTMMFSNPSKRDLDAWGLLGNRGWDWASLQPYFRKFEQFCPPAEALSEKMQAGYIDPRLRGTEGPLKTSFCDSAFGWLEEVWSQTTRNTKYPSLKDPRDGSSLGAFNQLMAIDPATKTRSYAYTAFLEPNLDRPNLHVLTRAMVSRIVFGGVQKDSKFIASGLHYHADGKEIFATAKNEVILSAGSIQSPHILELSGIGDKASLEKVGIECIVDNAAVGENLQDHPFSLIAYKAIDGIQTAESFSRSQELSESAMKSYMQDGTGPLAGGLTATGFSSLYTICPDMTDAEVNELIDRAELFQSTATRKQLKIQEDMLRDRNEAVIQWLPFAGGVEIAAAEHLTKMFKHDIPGNWISLAMISTHMFSRGSVHIKSKDPAEHPAIDPNYFSHPLDVQIMGRAIMHGRQLCRTDPWASRLQDGPDGDKIPIPGYSGPIQDPKTLDEAIEFAKYNSITCYHPIATCSMLPQGEGGVVDSELKVYGTANVRVVDASIFPLHVQGNIMSVVYAVAEKASDIIKGNAVRSKGARE